MSIDCKGWNPQMSSRLAEIIKKSNILSRKDLDRALEFSSRDGVSLALFILKNNMAPEDQLMKVISAGLGGIQVFYPDRMKLDPAILDTIPRDLALQHRVIPINRLANNLIVCSADPTDLANLDGLSAKLGVKLRVKLTSDLSIEKALRIYYLNKVEDKTRRHQSQLSGELAESYVVSYVDKLMQFAAQSKASDIHIEPFEKSIRVRLRMDGSLVEYKNKARFDAKDSLLTRVKILSGLDISEKRLPQDGNCKLNIPSHGQMDFRVSTLPTAWGEKIVMRLLDKSNLQLDLRKLGFEKEQLNNFMESIHQPFGMVIVTGPTGSGKTTTLYSALNELNRITDNVVTAEDPVEFTIPGLAQVNIRHDIGLTFAKALKAFLRQDPDVIMVGEVRDGETADIAMRAALTGHIVLSTLHTNNAPETLERLRNMGVEPFTICSALNCVVAQRLVRVLCSNCKQPDSMDAKEQIRLGLPERYANTFTVYKEVGCNNCNFTGFAGRNAIYEVMPMTDKLKRAVAGGANPTELKRIAMSEGMQTLRQSAWKKVYKGITSVSELLSASSSDEDAVPGKRKAS
jgi:type IV pilus assembly protein PilB